MPCNFARLHFVVYSKPSNCIIIISADIAKARNYTKAKHKHLILAF